MVLKYLFTAKYRDGSMLLQTPEDVSTRDPKRSAYYDVDHSKLTEFSILGPSGLWTVSLLTGRFYHNGHAFGTLSEELPVKERKLVYFRRHWHVFNVSKEATDQVSHRVTYHFGWSGLTQDGGPIESILWVE